MNVCCFFPQHWTILKDLSGCFARCFLSLQSEIQLNAWPRVTVGTTIARRVLTIILQTFFLPSLPFQVKLPTHETPSKKLELTLESKGNLQPLASYGFTCHGCAWSPPFNTRKHISSAGSPMAEHTQCWSLRALLNCTEMLTIEFWNKTESPRGYQLIAEAETMTLSNLHTRFPTTTRVQWETEKCPFKAAPTLPAAVKVANF